MPADVATTSAIHAVSWISPRSAACISRPVGLRRAAAMYDRMTAAAKAHIATRGAAVPGIGMSRPVSQLARYHSRTRSAYTFAGVPTPPSAGNTRWAGTTVARMTYPVSTATGSSDRYRTTARATTWRFGPADAEGDGTVVAPAVVVAV